MSVFLPPSKDANVDDDQKPEPRLKFYDVVCSKCGAGIGYPCMNKMRQVDYFSIHIARVLAWEALEEVEKMRIRIK